jgi:hypothetical protein
LDRIEASIVEILAAVQASRNSSTSHSQLIIERLRTVANNIDQLRDDFRVNTDLVAARIDGLISQITANADNTASPETLADLRVLSDHLKALGTSPTVPVPPVPPAPTV